jgi:D-tyrosyl-tRNA(Tyr) deacylase
LRVVIQRVKKSSVSVEGKIVSEIGHGLNLLVCLEKDDGLKQIEKAAQKVLAYRIFQDEESRMNRNILQAGGEILAISQFTLSWNGQKGNRPSFDNSMKPDLASELFDKFCELLARDIVVKKGVFGASMQVDIVNDGPVTFCFDF